jgi:DNA-binding MarR family transcriptional regulator
VEELRAAIQLLIRRFGALAADSTPCGKPLAIAHAHALMALESQGELTQQQLGQFLSIDKSNVARLCARMVENGHVLQTVSEQDARSRVVSLTANGRKLATEVSDASKERFSRLLGAIPRAQRATIVESLEQLTAAIEQTSSQEQER